MALTGLQIQKLLPKTNCKECGCNTCLAFAMKLAAKNAELAECPYASDEAKAVLGAAAEPPIRTVVLGNSCGNPFRHARERIPATLGARRDSRTSERSSAAARPCSSDTRGRSSARPGSDW